MSKSKKAALGILALLCALMLGFGLASCGGKDTEPTYGYGEEGTYYYDDASGEEYLLTLRGGTYVLTYGTTGRSGSYSYDAGEDAFAFTSGGEDTFEAATAEGALSLRYGGRTYLFLRYEYFTVTFTDGNDTLTTQSVLNGKAAQDPGAIERDGYVFYGWYQDAGFTKAFDFSSAVTADATAWGRYLPEGGDREFTVTYDLTGETAGTVNGVVYDLPEPEMSGYEFLGWWVSATNSADELTYRYDGETLNEDTTLFAVWAESGAYYIGASAYGDRVTWLASVGSTTEMAVYDAYGALLETRTAQSSSGSLSYDLSSLPAGRYTVEVTSGGVTETLTYVAKGLYRVSGYEVLPGSLFTYSPVENAERYYVSVECATESHDHTYVDNGTSLFFDFSDCDMGPDGITFTVIAYAEGYYYSVSSYTYFLGLDKAEVRVEGDSVLWDRVPYAMEYEVYVGGTLVCVTEGTSFSLKGYGPGTLEIEVRPVTRGYWSERSETYTYDKTTLAAPEISGVEGYEVTWTPVEGAAGYTVRIGGIETTVEAGITSLYLSDDNFTEGLDSYEIAVKALAEDSANDSPYGDAVVVTGADVGSAVTYDNGTVTWQYSLSAVEYRITVNDGDETIVTGTNNSPITLTKSGNNEIRIYFVNGDNEIYGTASVTVYAYAIVFDARGGTAYMGGEPVDVIYVAKGDAVTLPTAEYSGILADFVGWYTLPDTENTPDADGYLGDGYLYEDGTVFTGNSTIVLYACWINQRIKVSLNTGLGRVTDGDGNAIEYVEIPVGSSTYTIAVPEIDDRAYVFYGWYSGAGGTGYRYTYEDGSASTIFRDETATTLYAYWIKVLDFSATEFENYGTVASVTKGADIALVSEVTVPDVYTVDGVELTVRYVEGDAFQSLSTLEVLNLPDTILYMNVTSNGYASGSGALASSANIREVNVYATGEPSTTKDVRYYSDDGVLFRYDDETGMTELYYYPYGRTDETYEIPATVSNEFEYELQGLTEVPVVRDVTSLGGDAFRGHTELVYMVIPDTLNDLGTYTFYQCSNLERVVFSYGLETIGEYCFYQCTALKSADIPDSVASIGQYAFYGCSALESVTLPESLTAINDRTFYGCQALRSVELPYGLTSIGSYAFYQCYSITSVRMPSTVESIGTYCYNSCTGLVDIVLSSSLEVINDRAFYGCSSLTSVFIPEGVTTINTYAFGNCYMLSDVTLPSTLLSTGKYAFYNCWSLTTITIPANMESIDDYTFGDCYKLVEIYNLSGIDIALGDGTANGYVANYAKNVYTPYEGETHIIDIDGMRFIYDADGNYYFFEYAGSGRALVLPDDVEGHTYEIMNYAVYGNSYITSLVIPKAVTAMDKYAFYGCVRLESIYYDAGLPDYGSGNYVFYSAGKEGSGIEVTIGASVTRIPSYLFSPYNNADYTPNITKVVFEEGSLCETIGSYAFGYVASLVEIAIPEGVTTIENYVFQYCASLVDITLPSTLTSIGGYAFQYCTSLEGIEFPGSLESIGTYAFRGDTALKEIVIPDSVTSLGTYVFSQCTALKTVQLSSSLTEVPNYAFNGCESLAGIVIPEGVTSIGSNTFYGCYSLRYASLPSTLVTIGTSAFNRCYLLKQIVLPENLISIGNTAFNYCYKLVEVYNMSPYFEVTAESTSNGYVGYYAMNVYTPEDGETHIIQVDGYWFIYGDNDEYYLIDYDGDATELVLAEDIYGNPYSIYRYAFYENREITSIVIPSTITSIGNYAFYDCTNVEEIYYYATDADALASGNYAFAYVGQDTDGVTLYIGANVKSIPDCLFYPYSASSYAPNITNVVFEEGSVCESIGAYAFRGLTNLTSIVLPSSLKSIGDYAFYQCTALTSVVLPEGLESIGTYCFYGCTALKSVTIPSTVGEIATYAFHGCTALATLTILNGVKNIGERAFANCSALKSVTIPSSVTSVARYAFNGCSSLVNISILGNETLIGYDAFAGTAYYDEDKNWDRGALYIGDYLIVVDTSAVGGSYTIRDGTIGVAGRAFYNCTGLKSVTIPDSVKTLGEYMFYGCTSLSEVSIPDSVVAIGTYCFYNCVSLTALELPSSLTSIGTYAFYSCSAIRTMTIPDGVTELSDYLFYGCSSLERVTLPEGLTKIGGYVFDGCSSLEGIDIPDGVTEIGNYAFAYCESFTTVTVPEGIKDLSSYMFRGCGALESVNYSDTITAIGDHAFYECTSLKVVNIPDTVTDIGTYAFYGCTSLEKIYYDATALDDFTSSSYLFGRVGRDAETCVVYVGANVERIPAQLFHGSATPYITSVVFAGGSVCEEIGDYAFYQCSSLSYVNLPSGLTSIGSYAFYQCSALQTLDIPASVAYIGGRAFYGCSRLDGIVLPEGMTRIESYTFYECYALSSINIPSTVTEIGDRAFSECSALTTITIPASVELIDSYAFRYCYKLVEVCNLSSLDIVAGSVDNGYVAAYALHVYGEGEESALEDIGGLLFIADDAGEWYLVGYEGTDADVSLPEYVHGCEYSIYQQAFANSRIETVVVPVTVKTVGSSAFENCIYLTKVVFEGGTETIPGSAFSGCTALSVVVLDGVVEIGDSAFDGCESIETLVLPDTLTTIGTYAFDYCTGLKTLTIGAGVESVGNRAFEGCSALEAVYFNATDMGDLSNNNYVFSYGGQDGDGMTVYVGANVTRLPNYLFCPTNSSSTALTYAPKISSVVFEDGSVCEEIGTYCFHSSAFLADINLPDSLTTIGTYAFYQCYSLTSITLPASLSSIGGGAFNYCCKLVEVCNMSSLSISSGSGNGYVGNYAKNVYTPTSGYSHIFYADGYQFVYDASGYYLIGDDGTHEGKLYLPETVYGYSYEILNYAFYGRNDVTEILIPECVTAMGNYAFYNCRNVTRIWFNAADMADKSSSNYVFYQVGQDADGIEVTIGTNVTYVPSYLFFPYSSASNAPKITRIVFEEGGVCTEIGGYAFAYLSELEEIVGLPDTLKTIGTYAFEYCSSLSAIDLPDSVESMGNSVFYYCSGLESITLPASLKSLGTYAFRYCSSLEWAVIPDSLASIGNYTFANCTSLEYVIIGTGLTSVGNYAFYNSSSLSAVYYMGTEAQWNANVTIGSSNSPLNSADVYGYSEAEPAISVDGINYDGNWWHWVDGEPVAWIKG